MKMDNCTNSKNRTDCFPWERPILLFFQKYRFAALFGFFFGALLYSLMMSQQLTNTFDGLWQQNYRQSGMLELTSGRWMLFFADKLVMGLHADPIASMAALALYIIGFLLVLDLFGVESRLPGCLCLGLFLSSTAVSNTLSYRFTSIGYGLAYLLAVLGVYAAIKLRHPLAAMGLSGIFLGCTMACYQAYLAVFCTVALFYLIFLCQGETNLFRPLIRLGGSLMIGAVFYVASLSFFLTLSQASLSEYNGIGGISLSSMLLGLPQNVLKTYQYFGAYFCMDKLMLNRLQPLGALNLLLALLMVLIIAIAIKAWKVKKPRAAVVLLAAAALPVAGNAYMLILGDKLELQMTAGLAMFMPLTFVLAYSCFREKWLLQRACALFCVALLYGNSMQVWFDQEAMYEGRNACETMAAQVIDDLKHADLLSPERKYYFIGVPADNPYFSVSSIYDQANAYAQMGNFWVSGNCAQMSYHGLIHKYMGFNLPISYLSFEDVAEQIAVSDMPQFPEDGYMALLDEDTVVIKISDYKTYTGNSKYVFD